MKASEARRLAAAPSNDTTKRIIRAVADDRTTTILYQVPADLWEVVAARLRRKGYTVDVLHAGQWGADLGVSWGDAC